MVVAGSSSAVAAGTAVPAFADARTVVVVVHYRDAVDTLQCVHSIRTHAAGTPIVLVDNASPDGSGQQVARTLHGSRDVLLLRALDNLGFGAGCNLGIAQALATFPQLEHVLLLNPDARLGPGALPALRACAAHHPDAGIVGCRIVDGNGAVWFANGRFPRWTLSRFHCAPPPGATEFSAQFVTGCCMLIDAGLLRQSLRFDERFFLYGEDADLCRAVAARGRTLWITLAATIEHRGGGSQPGRAVLGELSAERLYWLTRAKVLLAKKHLPLWRRLWFYGVALFAKPAAALLAGHGVRWIGPYCRGLLAGWFSRPAHR